MARRPAQPAPGPRVGVILSGGASSRMGSPKALLLDDRGRTFLARLARTLRAGGCEVVLAVAGCHVAEIAPALPPGVLLAFNPDWTVGQLSSARVGLRAAVELRPSRVLLHPVDQPLIRPADVRAVLAAEESDVAVAAWRGETGHPICLSPLAAAAIASDRRSATLRDALARHAPRVAMVEGSRGCVRGANTPEELAALLAARRLSR